MQDISPYKMSSTDVTELTISTFHAALREGRTSITEVVGAYLARIAQHDPTIKSLITINNNALTEAAKKDQETHILLGSGLPRLHGVPVLLKDNYTTKDLPTSAGTTALRNLTSHDSEVVTHLRNAGAIILAKANLHEFALHGTTTSSLGGQTLNPYDLSRTPGGSSGGTGAALALNLGMVGCGTDTMNSLRSPASACSIVGFRPSTGKISCNGIVPVSETQDVAGPMGRSVADVRILFDVMSGNLKCPGQKRPETETDTDTDAGRRSSIRIGILDAYFHLENAESSAEDILAENAIVQDVVRRALSSAQDAADITLVPIPISGSQLDWGVSTLLAKADTQAFEFRECLNEFLQSEGICSPHSTLECIARSGEYHKEAVTDVFTLPLSDAETYSRSSEAYHARLSHITALKASVRQLFNDTGIDALAYPHQRQLPIKIGPTVQPARNGILAALTGRPAICIPGRCLP